MKTNRKIKISVAKIKIPTVSLLFLSLLLSPPKQQYLYRVLMKRNQNTRKKHSEGEPREDEHGAPTTCSHANVPHSAIKVYTRHTETHTTHNGLEAKNKHL